MATMEVVANTIRCLSADMIRGANSGHPGTPLGMAPAGAVLWAQMMKYNSANPKWFDRDRFILSNGHGSALQYSLLHMAGFIGMDDLKAFRQLHSRTPGHPEAMMTPGVEVTTGPLGQGIANGVGLAIAEAHLAATFNRPGYEIVNHNTWVFCGDGCLMEGVCQEALSFAGNLGLEKLIIVYDRNHVTIDGPTDITFTEDHAAKYRALGFHVIEVPKADTDFEGLRRAMEEAKATKGKPKMIVTHTTIGYGSVNEGKSITHGVPLTPEDIVQMKKKFNLDPEKKYYVPEEVYETFRKHVAKGKEAEDAWKDLMARYEKAFPAEAAQFKAQMAGVVPTGWEDKLPKNNLPITPCEASENCLAVMLPAIPAMMGGSADLTCCNLTNPGDKVVPFSSKTPEGRYFFFGVREHMMGAMMNGLDAHGGIIPFGGTFVNFVGYAMGALRVSALCNHRAIYVLTHDTIGIGEDGPTHQPVEMVNMLRAMPNVSLFRPCDQTETNAAWRVAVSRADGPTVLCLSNLVTEPQPDSSVEGTMKGAYILQDAQDPQLIIVSSGSEIGMCMNAAKTLSSSLRVRVVSMPSQDFFDAQPLAYRKSVLPDGVPVLSVEPYVSFGWEKYSHAHLGMLTYGTSAPAGELYKHYGITPAEIAKAGAELAKRYPNKSAADRGLWVVHRARDE